MSAVRLEATASGGEAGSPRPARLHFDGVAKIFPGRGEKPPFVAIRDVDLAVEPGRFICLIGPSGSGKSTLLNLAAGLFPPSSGTVSYDGTPIHGVNTRVGYITQKDNLLPWRTLARNVAIGLEISGMSRDERDRRVAEMIERVGLTGFEDRYPSQLSGGMKKRATLARSLINDPETLLMDEPFGALDAILRGELQQELIDLWQRDRKTVLFVTHDIEEAIFLADEIVVFGTNPGRIVHREEITLTRPRDFVELRRLPEFGEVWERLWSMIEHHEEPTA